MKRLVAVALLALVACGSDSSKGSPDVPSGNDAKWTTTVDPVTGRTFDCFTQWETQRTGLAMWCYEVSP